MKNIEIGVKKIKHIRSTTCLMFVFLLVRIMWNIFFNFQWENEDKYPKMASSEDKICNDIPQVWVAISEIELKYYLMKTFETNWVEARGE